MSKKIVSIFLMIATFSLLICNSISVFADNEAKSSHVSSNYSSLTLSSSYAKCTSNINGDNNVTKIMVTQTLQKKTSSGTWSDVKSWSQTFNKSSVQYVNNHNSSLKGTYRVKSYAKLYVGAKYEVSTSYSSTKTV